MKFIKIDKILVNVDRINDIRVTNFGDKPAVSFRLEGDVGNFYNVYFDTLEEAQAYLDSLYQSLNMSNSSIIPQGLY